MDPPLDETLVAVWLFHGGDRFYVLCKPQMKPNMGTVLLQADMPCSTLSVQFHLFCLSLQKIDWLLHDSVPGKPRGLGVYVYKIMITIVVVIAKMITTKILLITTTTTNNNDENRKNNIER